MVCRLNLQKKLEDILGSKEVYFQPPASIMMSYPAIVYKRSNIESDYADNSPYFTKTAYDVTVIDYNPDSVYVEKIARLPLCRHTQHFVSDNLNHDIFTIYIGGIN